MDERGVGRRSAFEDDSGDESPCDGGGGETGREQGREGTAKFVAEHARDHVGEDRAGGSVAENFGAGRSAGTVEVGEERLQGGPQGGEGGRRDIKRGEGAVEAGAGKLAADQGFGFASEFGVGLGVEAGEAGAEFVRGLVGVGGHDRIEPAHGLGEGLAFQVDTAVGAEARGVEVRQGAEELGDGVVSSGALGFTALVVNVGEEADPGVGLKLALEPAEEGEVVVVGWEGAGGVQCLAALQVAPVGVRGQEDFAELEPGDDKEAFPVIGGVHHDGSRRRAPHGGHFLAAGDGQPVEPALVNGLGDEGDFACMHAAGEFAGGPGANVGGFQRHAACEGREVGQRIGAGIVTPGLELGEKANEARLHIEERDRRAAEVGLAAALAPVGENNAFLGVRCAPESSPSECAGDAPVELGGEWHELGATVARGPLGCNHKRLDHAVALCLGDKGAEEWVESLG